MGDLICFQQKFWKNCLLNYFYIHYPPQISIHSVFFYAPASNEMARAYINTLFCHSVLSSFCPSVIPSSFTFQSMSQQLLHTFNSNFIYGCVIDIFRLSENLVLVWWFLKELCLFNLEKKEKFSVFAFWLLKGYIYKAYVSYVGYFKRKIQVEFEFGSSRMVFWQS